MLSFIINSKLNWCIVLKAKFDEKKHNTQKKFLSKMSQVNANKLVENYWFFHV